MIHLAAVDSIFERQMDLVAQNQSLSSEQKTQRYWIYAGVATSLAIAIPGMEDDHLLSFHHDAAKRTGQLHGIPEAETTECFERLCRLTQANKMFRARPGIPTNWIQGAIALTGIAKVFAATYGLGTALDWQFRARAAGQTVSEDDLQRAYERGRQQGREEFKRNAEVKKILSLSAGAGS